MSEERGLTTIESSNLDLVPQMVMSTQQALARLQQFQEFVNAVMVPGVDYGKIAGIDKPCLLKPGAEKLCEIYALTPEVEVVNRIEDWQGGFFHYECRCRLISRRTGHVQAVGVGSCNSREKRYSDRWVFASDIPAGVDRATLQSREFTSKKGDKFKKYLWKNEDIYTQVNTILKMAKKRALVDAALTATRSSGLWTQDVEDWVEGEVVPATNGHAEQPKAEPKAAAKPAGQPGARIAHLCGDAPPDKPHEIEPSGKWSAEKVAAETTALYGRAVCYNCHKLRVLKGDAAMASVPRSEDSYEDKPGISDRAEQEALDRAVKAADGEPQMPL